MNSLFRIAVGWRTLVLPGAHIGSSLWCSGDGRLAAQNDPAQLFFLVMVWKEVVFSFQRQQFGKSIIITCKQFIKWIRHTDFSLQKASSFQYESSLFASALECSFPLTHGYHRWLKDICLAGVFGFVLLFTMKNFKHFKKQKKYYSERPCSYPAASTITDSRPTLINPHSLPPT